MLQYPLLVRYIYIPFVIINGIAHPDQSKWHMIIPIGVVIAVIFLIVFAVVPIAIYCYKGKL